MKEESTTAPFDRVRTHVGQRNRTLVICLVVVAVLTSIFLWYGREVSEGEMEAFDYAIRNYVNGLASPPLTAVIKMISFTGKVLTLIGLGAVAAAILAYLRRWRDLALLLVTMGVESLLEVSLKDWYERARPPAFFNPIPIESYSFPSGHALGSLCFYTIITYIAARHVRNRRTRIAIAVPVALWILAIGFSRIYLGVHYPSDVLGGYFVGVIWLTVVIAFDRYLGGPEAATYPR